MLEVGLSYPRYAAVLKWTTLSLFTYVAVVLVADVPWGQALRSLVVPEIKFNAAYATAFVAILGTTISPYLFFWQAAQEIEEAAPPPRQAAVPRAARRRGRNCAGSGSIR